MSRASPSSACGGIDALLPRPGWRPRALFLLALLPGPPAHAQDGRAVFDRSCASCHAVTPGAPPMAGPNLHGLVGRRLAGDAGFDYSPALAEGRERGDRWDAERLQRFLEDPEEMYPGLWMGGNGLHDAAERRSVVEFLSPPR